MSVCERQNDVDYYYSVSVFTRKFFLLITIVLTAICTLYYNYTICYIVIATTKDLDYFGRITEKLAEEKAMLSQQLDLEKVSCNIFFMFPKYIKKRKRLSF